MTILKPKLMKIIMRIFQSYEYSFRMNFNTLDNYSYIYLFLTANILSSQTINLLFKEYFFTRNLFSFSNCLILTISYLESERFYKDYILIFININNISEPVFQRYLVIFLFFFKRFEHASAF